MSRAATHIETIMEVNSYSIRLRGAPPPTQPQPPLSPIGIPHLAPWGAMYPTQTPTAPIDYFDRSQNPPPLERQRCIPLPRIPGGPVNPLLERAPVPMIVYDIAQPDTSATFDRRHRTAYGRSLDEPATNPATTSLTIRAPFTPKPIVVHRNGAIITVRDVLASVHLAVRQTAHEHGIVKPEPYLFSPNHFGFVPESSDSAVLASMLGNRSRWAGLSPSPTEQDVWVLHIK